MLYIRMLGGFEATLDSKPLPGLGPQLRRLLALLALEADRRVESARLWKDLWPDSDTPDVVRQSVARMRTALGSEGYRLVVDGGTVCLDLRGAAVDTVVFSTLVEKNTTVALAEAVQLYRGDLLQGWEGAWITTQREDLHTSYLDALKTLATQAIDSQNPLAAIGHLRRFVTSLPEMDWGWEALIRAYIDAGSRLKAIETYRYHEEYLRRESKGRKIALQPSRVIRELIEQLVREEQSRTLAQIQDSPVPVGTAPAQHAEAIVPPPLESVGGATPIGSPYYLTRPEEDEVYAALASSAQTGYTVLIKGPRQIGKSSLLARILHRARQQNACVLLTDWQNLPNSELDTAETFFLSLAYSLAEQLELDGSPEANFLVKRPAASNFERFLRRQVFPVISGPIVWGIDEADRLFPCPFCDDVFGKFRAWHNERALDPTGPWRRLSLILAYSTEASLFIKNINQSPFNVGTRVTLHDFTPAQAQELNVLYGSPLSAGQQESLYHLVGGHPYLLRRALCALQQKRFDLTRIEADAEGDGGIFHDHLERMRFALLLDEELTGAVRGWLRGETVPNQGQFARLCAAGIMTGRTSVEMQARCLLYDRYLKKHLL